MSVLQVSIPEERRETPNANPEIANIRFIGQPDSANLPNLETIVRDRIGEQTIRKEWRFSVWRCC